jgi:voltage-gated potassium channel Kch
MPQDAPLITAIVAALVLAFVLGAIANRLRISPLVANIHDARCLIVAIPDAFEGGQVVAQARAVNSDLPIIARSHSDDETMPLKAHGATRVIMGEEETGLAMLAEQSRL